MAKRKRSTCKRCGNEYWTGRYKLHYPVCPARRENCPKCGTYILKGTRRKHAKDCDPVKAAERRAILQQASDDLDRMIGPIFGGRR